MILSSFGAAGAGRLSVCAVRDTKTTTRKAGCPLRPEKHGTERPLHIQRQRQLPCAKAIATLRFGTAESQGESRCGAIRKLHGAVATLAIISHNRSPIMFTRILRVVLLLLWLELGLLLILMPWSEVWDVNYFLYQYPALAIFVKNSFLRGMISGLGVMNVLFALEAFRRRTAAVVTRT
jgi:hypothetical protein